MRNKDYMYQKKIERNFRRFINAYIMLFFVNVWKYAIPDH